jgi:hypothetical protein
LKETGGWDFSSRTSFNGLDKRCLEPKIKDYVLTLESRVPTEGGRIKNKDEEINLGEYRRQFCEVRENVWL